MLKATDSKKTYKGVQVESIRTSENYDNDIGDLSNKSYLFTYKGIKILHLGDIQGDIININNKNVREQILKVFPDKYDLLLMPIEGTTRFMTQGEVFLNLLMPKRFIPMHYWTISYKDDFLDHLEKSPAQGFDVQKFDSAEYSLFDTDTSSSTVELISLEPGAFIQNTSFKTSSNTNLEPGS